MREKIKTGVSVGLILLLLPYVAMVFRTGSMNGLAGQEETAALETFVAGILPGQMPASYEEEALKAQAVVIRTNLLKKAAEYYGTANAAEAAAQMREEDLAALGFSYYSREQESALWGRAKLEEYAEKCDLAAQETAGQVLTLTAAEDVSEEEMTDETDGADTKSAGEGAAASETAGVLAATLPDLPYHAVSAGATRDGAVLGEDYAWLKSADCSGDLQSPQYLEVQVYSAAEAPWESLPEILAQDAAGYVTSVRVGGETLSGEDFRSRYGLNSSCFTVEETAEGIRLTTKGLGHGLGLSMYQANLLAQEGRNYQEILAYFYQGTACISITESGYPSDSN